MKKKNEDEKKNKYWLSHLLENWADAVIQWKFLEYFLVYKICN